MCFYSTSSGQIELEIKRRDAIACSHQGPCDDDVRALSEQPYIRRQLSALSVELLASELSEYGAWEDSELADHEQNKQRLLWLACGDIVDSEED